MKDKKNENAEWENLQQNQRDDCFKYLILIKRFMKNSSLLSKTHKKWLLENCNLPTHSISNEILTENNSWLDGSFDK